ncbi:hypothetical protein [Micromonospora sp. WMMD980]|uniref:hypothetical protein n=1 Tax=Micromonospora sp. WMMD980 TaxID=3016088 RepID=UPI00241630E4|nr:hypothetical protein [Micromonospora sp. WMMD980]MDG4799506.1 hypothetical protein [Micromonospora sp. WMMD980]
MHQLQAALTAASLDQAEEASAHFAEAERVAQLTGSDPWRMEFTPANVGVWRVNIALENGEPERAPEYARRVDRTALRTRQRLAHLHIGAGRGLYLAGDSEGAVRQFLTADQVSKSELRSRPTVREIVGQMVRDSRTRGGSDQLRDLATRLNIDPLAPNGEPV